MEITAAFLKEKHPEIANALIEEGKLQGIEAGRTEGAEAERNRIKAVQDQAMAGHEALIADMMFDGKTTGEQAAVRILQAERQVRADIQNKLDSDAVPPLPQPPAPADPPKPADSADDQRPIEDRAKEQWDKDKKLRSEFLDDFNVYLAYLKADENGQVRILKK